MKIDFSLNFNGNCREAFETYQSILGIKDVHFLTFGQSPLADTVPVAFRDKIINGDFSLGNVRISGGDVLPEQYQPLQGFRLLLQSNSLEKSRAIFNALRQGGEVVMELQETFWSPCYGLVNDRFGVPWKINTTIN